MCYQQIHSLPHKKLHDLSNVECDFKILLIISKDCKRFKNISREVMCFTSRVINSLALIEKP